MMKIKRLIQILAMAATAWAAEATQPAEAGTNPPATVAWGDAVNGVQIGLVPLGRSGWNGFQCARHARQRHAMPSPEEKQKAVMTRCCELCGASKPWGVTFFEGEGEPMRMELHFRNLAKEERSLYDASHGGSWSFTFTQVGGGKVWKASWSREEERTMEGIARSTIKLAVGQQNAVEMDLELHSLGMLNLDGGGQSAIRSLLPGKYTVTANYAHPGIHAVHGNPNSCGGHEQGKPCTYWRGAVTTGPVEIEVKPVEPETEAQREAKRVAEAKAQIERKQQIDRELELKQRAVKERGQ